MKTEKVYACPTCKRPEYVEVFKSMNPLNEKMRCYCRRCEEGCVDAIVIDFPIAQTDRATHS